jgi:hypothetical protein
MNANSTAAEPLLLRPKRRSRLASIAIEISGNSICKCLGDRK